jgi:hypothetical protein
VLCHVEPADHPFRILHFMNSLTRVHMPATFFALYQALRGQLLDTLSDEDLAFSLGGSTKTLGVLCREIGDVEQSYVDSFRTFRQTFDYRHGDARVEHSVVALRSWYATLDRDLLAAVEAISEDDISNRRIKRGDFDADFFSPLPAVQLDIYREALLIFYGKATIYLRAMGRPLPGDWPDWIE